MKIRYLALAMLLGLNSSMVIASDSEIDSTIKQGRRLGQDSAITESDLTEIEGETYTGASSQRLPDRTARKERKRVGGFGSPEPVRSEIAIHELAEQIERAGLALKYKKPILKALTEYEAIEAELRKTKGELKLVKESNARKSVEITDLEHIREQFLFLQLRNKELESKKTNIDSTNTSIQKALEQATEEKIQLATELSTLQDRIRELEFSRSATSGRDAEFADVDDGVSVSTYRSQRTMYSAAKSMSDRIISHITKRKGDIKEKYLAGFLPCFGHEAAREADLNPLNTFFRFGEIAAQEGLYNVYRNAGNTHIGISNKQDFIIEAASTLLAVSKPARQAAYTAASADFFSTVGRGKITTFLSHIDTYLTETDRDFFKKCVNTIANIFIGWQSKDTRIAESKLLSLRSTDQGYHLINDTTTGRVLIISSEALKTSVIFEMLTPDEMNSYFSESLYKFLDFDAHA